MGVYEEMAREIGALVEEKNAAYGSAFDRAGEVLKILYPYGIEPEQYVDALGIVRVLDKMFRIAHNKGAFGESPWKDIAGYGLLGAVRHREEQEGTPERSLLTVDNDGTLVDELKAKRIVEGKDNPF